MEEQKNNEITNSQDGQRELKDSPTTPKYKNELLTESQIQTLYKKGLLKMGDGRIELKDPPPTPKIRIGPWIDNKIQSDKINENI